MYVKRKLQVVVFFRKGNSLCLGAYQSADRLGQKNRYNSYCSQLLIVFLHQGRINANLSRCKCRSGDKVESGIAEKPR